MKKLTFLEALKVNETRKVIESFYPANRPALVFYPNEMAKSGLPLASFTNSEWEVVPEKFEFECRWEHSETKLVIPTWPDFNLEKLVGKRTKVTVEVIEND